MQVPYVVSAVVGRVRSLIASRDGGDVTATARRLRLPISTVLRLDEALREPHPASTDLLASVAVCYHVDAVWLLFGDDREIAKLDPTARLRVCDLLLAIGERLVAASRARRLGDLAPGMA